jgi:hypothetical protein
MKVRNRLAKALNINKEEEDYILSLRKKRYCIARFVINILIILLSIFLPILYLTIAKQEEFLPASIIEAAQSSNFLLYKSTWVSHVFPMFIAIPSFLIICFYVISRPFKNFSSYLVLKSAAIYYFSPRKLFLALNSETLEEKVALLRKKIIFVSATFFLLSSVLCLFLFTLDSHNYTVITDNGIVHRGYGKLQTKQLKWQDLASTKSGCAYVLSSYRNTFIRMRWYYILSFNNGLMLDLYNFKSLQGKKLAAISAIDTIASAVGAQNYADQDRFWVLNKSVPTKRCVDYLKKHHESYKELIDILKLNDRN